MQKNLSKMWLLLALCIFAITAVIVMPNIQNTNNAITFAAVTNPVPTPTPKGVIATGRRTITQPLMGYNATDLHFIVYQADRDDAWILDWNIKLNVPFTEMRTKPSDWPFNDGKIHSVAIDIYGINVPYGETVNIEALLNLNEYNTVKFADIKWTYKDHEPVNAMSANIGWAVETNPGSSKGGFLISKYTVVDLNDQPIAVDLVGHQFRTTDVSPAYQDMSVSNGVPGNPGNTTVRIKDWGVAIVPVLPSFDEIDQWTNWDQFNKGPIDLGPGQRVQFHSSVETPPPGGYVVIYDIINDWGTGAVVYVTIINNTSMPVNGWNLTWTFPGNQTITNMWNASFTQLGSSVAVKDGGLNAYIPAGGGEVNFGFNMNYSGGNYKPAGFKLNGVPCQ